MDNGIRDCYRRNVRGKFPWKLFLVISILLGLCIGIPSGIVMAQEAVYIDTPGGGAQWVDPVHQTNIVQGIRFGLIGWTLGVAGVFALLSLVYWLWYFILVRLAEARAALRLPPPTSAPPAAGNVPSRPDDRQ